MKLTKKLEAEVTKVYDTWLRSYLNGDVKTYDSYLDKEYHFIGSTDNEDFLTKKGTTKFFKTTADQLAGKSQIKNNIRTIEQFDGLVFITERFDANFLIGSKWVYYGKFRFSSVMQKKAGGWRFIYQHFSLPDSKAAEGETLGAEQVSKENQELRDAIKRRTAELEIKNRELEIETSLERVRAKTMAMQKSEELKEVIQVVYDQFIQLNIKIEHTGFVLDYKERNDYDIWIADQLEVPSHVTIPYFDCIYYNRFNEAKKKGEDFFATNLNFKEKNKFYKKLIEFIPGLPEETKEFLFSIPGLAASTVLLDNVCLYIENFEGIPYTAEENDVLMRFGKVFQQTYTRFLDLQKAEVQAREAEIELALERVRARTMAMQHSEELLDVASILFQQVKGLGVPQWNCGFNIWNLGDKEFTYYPGSPEGIISPSPCKIPLTKHPVFMRFDESRRRGDDLLIYEKQGEEQEDHYRYMLSLPGVGDLLRSMLDAGFELPAFQIDHVVNFAYGNLIFITFEHFPGMHDVFKRFAKVFEQTYTRFLDLQKSEAQAREAQIQLALERVRAKTMAMQKSDELPETSHILFEQMKELGEPVEQLTIGIVQEENNMIEISATLHGDTLKKIYLHSIDEPYMMTKVYKAWKTQQKTLIVELKGDELNSYNKYRNELTNSEMFPTNLGDEHRRIVYVAFFSKGMFALGANEPRPPQTLQLLERFASVFDLTYTRFLDLQKAEAQARESQIEAALERVRSRSMAMHKTNELLDAAELVYKELSALGINSMNISYAFVDEEEKYGSYYSVNPVDGRIPPFPFVFPHTETKVMLSLLSSWKKQEPFNVIELDEKATLKHQTYIGEHILRLIIKNKIDIPFSVGSFLAISPKTAVIYSFNFTQGYLFVIGDERLTTDQEQLLLRFTKVFEQTYTRFLDLQKAEAQAREGQIELGLERVRSRAMAMQTSDELAELVDTLFKELTKLDFTLTMCIINIIDERNLSNMVWAASPETGKPPESYHLKFEDYPFHHAMMKGYQERDPRLIYVIEGDEKKIYDEYLFNETEFRKIPQEGQAAFRAKEKYVASFSFSNFGGLQTVSDELLTESNLDILARFGKVFDLTYTRFNDLKNAEALAHKSKIEVALERVRARALAMQEPEELKEVAEVLRHEMGLLGVEELETCSIYINDEQAAKAECWYALKDLRSEEKKLVSDHFALNLNDTWVGREMLQFYQSTEKQTSIIMTGDNRIEWIRMCEEKSAPFQGYYGEVIPDRTYHLYKFSHGAIGAAAAGDISKESWELLRRAAAVFSLAYSRFKDLTQARIDLERLKTEKQRAEDALTNLKAAQSQLVQSEKMASLGELTAGIAHEIQNPLNFVNNFSEVSNELLDEMLEEAAKGNYEEVKEILKDVKQNLEKINHHGKRADGIVKGMLQHSRSSSGTKEPTDINALADEYLRLAYHGLRAKDKSFNATMKTDFDETIGNINIIPQDIGRVILNLITNAFYVVNEKSKQNIAGYEPTVTVSTSHSLSSGEGRGEVRISVKDNGNGIPQKILDKIFQPFFTTKPTGQGTGLGLSLSYDIIKAHGGELMVETKHIESLPAEASEQAGTEFIITLPK